VGDDCGGCANNCEVVIAIRDGELWLELGPYAIARVLARG
jgi:hypothetical protein